MLVVR
jgi:hypothetical protein